MQSVARDGPTAGGTRLGGTTRPSVTAPLRACVDNQNRAYAAEARQLFATRQLADRSRTGERPRSASATCRQDGLDEPLGDVRRRWVRGGALGQEHRRLIGAQIGHARRADAQVSFELGSFLGAELVVTIGPDEVDELPTGDVRCGIQGPLPLLGCCKRPRVTPLARPPGSTP